MAKITKGAKARFTKALTPIKTMKKAIRTGVKKSAVKTVKKSVGNILKKSAELRKAVKKRIPKTKMSIKNSVKKSLSKTLGTKKIKSLAGLKDQAKIRTLRESSGSVRDQVPAATAHLTQTKQRMSKFSPSQQAKIRRKETVDKRYARLDKTLDVVTKPSRKTVKGISKLIPKKTDNSVGVFNKKGREIPFNPNKPSSGIRTNK